jgi:hypothetical protein
VHFVKMHTVDRRLRKRFVRLVPTEPITVLSNRCPLPHIQRNSDFGFLIPSSGISMTKKTTVRTTCCGLADLRTASFVVAALSTVTSMALHLLLRFSYYIY